MGILILLAAIILAALAFILIRRRKFARLGGILLILPALVALTFGGYWTWFTHRRQPPPADEQWCHGVVYQRFVLQSPRPIVFHLVRIDLRTPGLEFVFTPVIAAAKRPLQAAMLSSFLRDNHAQVAINANFYYPFCAKSPLSYYPHESDPVQVAGIAAYRGVLYQPHPFDPPFDPAATLFFSQDNRPSFTPPQTIYNAISGNAFLVRQSKNVAAPDAMDPINPRTAIGLDEAEATLFFAVIDGKQPNYSLGVTLPEFADLLLINGVHTAINLDGGGSSSLVRESDASDHHPQLISSPSNFRIPWWERPIANHIGVRFKPLP